MKKASRMNKNINHYYLCDYKMKKFSDIKVNSRNREKGMNGVDNIIQ